MIRHQLKERIEQARTPHDGSVPPPPAQERRQLRGRIEQRTDRLGAAADTADRGPADGR